MLSFAFVTTLLVGADAAGTSSSFPWMDPTKPAPTRAALLLAAMNKTETLVLLQGSGGVGIGNTAAIPRLGVPSFHLEDGPSGVADWMTDVTNWPSSMTMAASFDTGLLQAYGVAMGSEQAGKGMHVMLGPGVNIARVPYDGRNFEYLGEDPTLAGKMAAAIIVGAQSEGVVACVKHFADNNQEGPHHNGRLITSSVVGERAQWELYYPAFQAAVNAGVGSVMCSYNLVNGTYACENKRTLTTDLKERMNFTSGWVVSDWGADHGSVGSLNAGMDQTMSGAFNKQTTADILGGKVPWSRVEDAATRILVPLFEVGAFDRKTAGDPHANVATPEHAALAEKFAEETAVLLKNEAEILPLAMKRGMRIGIVGDAENVKGGGSGSVWSKNIISPTDGVISFLKNVSSSTSAAATVDLEAGADACDGCKCNCTVGIDYNGNDLHDVSTTSAAACCDACIATAGCNAWSWNGVNSKQCWLKSTPLGGYAKISWTVSGIVPGWLPPTPPPPPPPVQCASKVGPLQATVCNHSVPYKNCGMGQCNQTMCTTVVTQHDIDSAVAVAKETDVVIVNVAVTMTEGFDRDNLGLGPMQDKLVESVAAANPNTIVVVRCPGAVLMPWIDKVKAVIVQFLPGQASGAALASLIFGKANPSGKLPLSFPASETQHWLTSAEQYPGVLNASKNGQYVASYTEGLEIGYRWFDAKNETPLFEFGAGKSYTTFSYSGIAVTAREVSFTLTNTGSSAGAEVPQLYLGFPKSAGEPPKVLRNFTKVMLQKGESETVTFAVSDADRRVWDVEADDWRVVQGGFQYMVGSSSRDIRLVKTFDAATVTTTA